MRLIGCFPSQLVKQEGQDAGGDGVTDKLAASQIQEAILKLWNDLDREKFEIRSICRIAARARGLFSDARIVY